MADSSKVANAPIVVVAPRPRWPRFLAPDDEAANQLVGLFAAELQDQIQKRAEQLSCDKIRTECLNGGEAFDFTVRVAGRTMMSVHVGMMLRDNIGHVYPDGKVSIRGSFCIGGEYRLPFSEEFVALHGASRSELQPVVQAMLDKIVASEVSGALVHEATVANATAATANAVAEAANKAVMDAALQLLC
jgi:hypothetical protein